MKRSFFAYVVLASFFILPSTALAAAPFSDTFDDYQFGSLYSQGLWQNNQHVWQVTDQGCYQNTGRCIVTTGQSGENWKSGADLAKGDWRFRFYLPSQFTPYGLNIFFGSAEVPTGESALGFANGANNTAFMGDNVGNIVASNMSLGAWHTVDYSWDMTDPHNCNFLVTVDGVATSTAPAAGNPSNCYNNVFAKDAIGSIALWAYYPGTGFIIDDIGDGPVVSGCTVNCGSLANPDLSNSFDLASSTSLWNVQPPSNSYMPFAFDNGSAGDCHSGGCLSAVGSFGSLISGSMASDQYYETGVGRDAGAITLWANETLASSGSVSICASVWSNCFGEYKYQFGDVVPHDGVWHQLYFAWRQGASSVEFCKLLDDTSAADCQWKSSTFELGTALDGIELYGFPPHTEQGDHVLFDDLQDLSSLASTTSPVCTSNCYSNVMFLPGIEGSRLYENSGSGDKKLWEPGSDADALRLSMNADGSSQNMIYTKVGDVVDQVCVTVFCANIYKSFIANMDDLKAQGVINDWEPITYDWRLSFSQLLDGGTQNGSQISYLSSSSAPYIISQLKALAATSKTGKVTLVTHSNGGLLAKALMMRLGPDASKYIDKVIMVAAPQLGTPEAIPDILHGNAGIKFLLSNSASRSVAQNLPGAYNLLPSNNYFTYVDDPVVSFDPATLPDWVSKYGSVVHSTARLQAFMTDSTRTAPATSDLDDPIVANGAIFDASTATHAALDAWVAPADIKVYEIAGWGNDTLSGIEYKKVVTATCTSYLFGLCTNATTSSKLTFDPKEVVDGDGTVVTPSALWSNGASTTQYWVDLKFYNADHKTQSLFGVIPFAHDNILSISQVNTVVINLLTNIASTPLPQYISTSQPSSTNVNRLHFVLHSPLTLGYTDSSGSYTGSTATTTLFNSPDVQYQRYGDVQYLSVPANTAGTLVMHGTASGSFSLDVEQVSGNTIVATTSFQGVVSSTSTIATMQIVATGSPTTNGVLQVDFDGDGKIDSTLQAKQGAIVLPDITPPEAVLSADIAAHDLGVVGVDDVSSTTLQKTATTTTVVDASGNKTTLTFQKTYSGKLLTYAKLASIQYGGAAPIQLPTSFTYLWDAKQTLVSQTVIADKQFVIQALYDKIKNKTTVILLQKNIPIKTQTVTGLAIIKLTTSKGGVSYGW